MPNFDVYDKSTGHRLYVAGPSVLQETYAKAPEDSRFVVEAVKAPGAGELHHSLEVPTASNPTELTSQEVAPHPRHVVGEAALAGFMKQSE